MGSCGQPKTAALLPFEVISEIFCSPSPTQSKMIYKLKFKIGTFKIALFERIHTFSKTLRFQYQLVGFEKMHLCPTKQIFDGIIQAIMPFPHFSTILNGHLKVQA